MGSVSGMYNTIRAFGRLPEQDTGEMTARCHRRDINLTANNTADIAAHDIPLRLHHHVLYLRANPFGLNTVKSSGEIKRR